MRRFEGLGAWWAVTVFAVGCGGDPGSGDAASGGSDETSESASAETSASTTETPGTGSADSASASMSDSTPETDDGAESSGPHDDIEVIELRVDDFTPPLTETWYSCFSFQVEVSSLYHIVGFVPHVTSPLVHHYVLSLQDGWVQTNPSDACFEWPAGILWAWAPGIEAQMLPEDVGFLLGDAAGGKHTFVLQVHYNDPLLQGLVDNDGIDVLVTKNLRPQTGGVFAQGDIGAISIPPGHPSYEHVATCSSLLSNQILSHPITVFSSFLHAHEIGKAIWTDVWRNDELVGRVAKSDPFDFNAQRFVDTDIVIEPGDRIQTTCIYDSTGRTETTEGGVASDEEMCINFMMYYPKNPFEVCGLI